MSGISSISSSSNTNYYSQIASGSKLQSAADGAAELTILQEENAQIRGNNVGTNNMESAKDMLNISDAALESISDYLQRIRELAVQASNTATTTDSDRQAMQDEVEQLKQGITDVTSYTSYNTKNLLDGSNTEFQFATNANGSTVTTDTIKTTLEELGIQDFDVTGSFDLKTIDDAIEKVNSARSSAGAQSNALDYAISNNKYTTQNLVGADSRLEDLDIPKAISDMKKEETLQLYEIMMQKKRMEEEDTKVRGYFM